MAAGARSGVSLAAVLVVAHLAAEAVGGVLDPDLARRAAGAGDARVILHFDAPPLPDAAPDAPRAARRAALVRSLRATAERAQGPARRMLPKLGGRDLRTLWAAGALAATVPAAALPAVARLPGVRRVRADTRFALPPDPAPATPLAAPTRALSAPAAGAGVVVATLDSGADLLHPALAGRWRGEPGGWFDAHGEHEAPVDTDGHGTQVLGLMVGGPPGEPVGVAPGATWIAARIYDDGGETSLSAIHAAFQWLLDPDGDPATDDAPDVVNGSFGLEQQPGTCDPELRGDLRALRAAGVAVVFAAGNGGPSPGTSISPANYPEAFSVGAVGLDLLAAGFSARGPSACGGGIYPTVVAPGVGVPTTDLTFGGLLPSSYAAVTATSFAAPQVAGLMAVILGEAPELPLAELEAAVRVAALDLGAAGPDMAHGHGLADVAMTLAVLEAGCGDADGDGSPSAAGCGKPADCDDGNPGRHPWAAEVRGDGVDQDCSGADLTIAVDATTAAGTLVVQAWSARGPHAALVVAGPGPTPWPMEWRPALERWLLVAPVPHPPPTVTVTGPEGSVSAPVAHGATPSCRSGGSSGSRDPGSARCPSP